MLRKTLLQTVGASCAILIGLSAANAETIKIAAEEAGGGWYSYSATFTKIIEKSTGGKIDVEIIPRGGGIANPPVVDRHIADFGFSTSNATAWARDGLQTVYKGKKHPNVRAVIGGLQFAYTIVMARADYVKKTGLKTLDDMMSADDLPQVGMEPTGSQVPVIADFIFDSMGTSLKELRAKKTLTQVSSSQLAQLIRDGGIDLYFENVPAGQATVTEVTLTNDIFYVPMSDKVLADLAKVGLPTGYMPKGTFKGQTEDYKTALSATVFIVNKDVPEETVYQVTKALVENAETLQAEHGALKAWDPKVGCQPEQTIVDLHPGAARYYRERGWIK